MTRYEEDIKDLASARQAGWINEPERWSPPSQAFRAIAGTKPEGRSTRPLELAVAGLAGALMFAVGLRLWERR